MYNHFTKIPEIYSIKDTYKYDKNSVYNQGYQSSMEMGSESTGFALLKSQVNVSNIQRTIHSGLSFGRPSKKQLNRVTSAQYNSRKIKNIIGQEQRPQTNKQTRKNFTEQQQNIDNMKQTPMNSQNINIVKTIEQTKKYMIEKYEQESQEKRKIVSSVSEYCKIPSNLNVKIGDLQNENLHLNTSRDMNIIREIDEVDSFQQNYEDQIIFQDNSNAIRQIVSANKSDRNVIHHFNKHLKKDHKKIVNEPIQRQLFKSISQDQLMVNKVRVQTAGPLNQRKKTVQDIQNIEKKKQKSQQLSQRNRKTQQLKVVEVEYEDKISVVDFKKELSLMRLENVYEPYQELKLYQGPLDGTQNQKLIKMDQQFADEFNIHLDQINTKFETQKNLEAEHEEIEKQKGADIEFIRVNAMLITELEMNQVIQEYKKKQINFHFIDSIVQRLKFFIKSEKQVRIALLNQSKLQSYQRHDYVYYEDDYINQENMFVILRGGVNIYKNLRDANGRWTQILQKTLSEGDIFGDLGLIGSHEKQVILKGQSKLAQMEKIQTFQDLKEQIKHEEQEQDHLNKIKYWRSRIEKDQNEQKVSSKNKDACERNIVKFEKLIEEEIERYKQENAITTSRENTAQIMEETIVLAIDKYYYKEILMVTLGKQLEAKVEILKIIPWFSQIQNYALIPLANILKTKRFTQGDIIIKQGEIPYNFYIVSSGRVKVCKQQIYKRGKIPDVKSIRPLLTYEPFRFGKQNNEKNKNKKVFSNDDLLEDMMSEVRTPKVFEYDIVSGKNEDFKAYNKLIDHDVYQTGGYFSNRALLTPCTSANLNEGYDNYSNIEKAKLSVIADSIVVELFYLDRTQLQFLPQLIKDVIFFELSKEHDFDSVNVKEMETKDAQWDNYKKKLFKQKIQDIANKRQLKKIC